MCSLCLSKKGIRLLNNRYFDIAFFSNRVQLQSIFPATARLDSIKTSKMKRSKKLKQYFYGDWNWFDFFGILFFFIGMLLRFISIGSNEKVYYAAK